MTDTQVNGSTRAHDRPEPDDERRPAGAFRTSAGLLAVVLIAVQALWRGGALAGGFFTQDDYVLLRRADSGSLDLAYLLEVYAGEISPVGNLLVWLVTSVAPLDWGAAATAIVLLQAVAAAMTWLVLSRLLPGRWVRVPLVAVACFAPLTLGSTMWWSLAMMHLPAVVLLLTAVLALLAHLQDDWEPGPVVAGAAITLALLCSDHTLLLPLVLPVVVAGVLPSSTGGAGARFAAALRLYPRLWAYLVVALAARILLERWQSDDTFGLPRDGEHVTDVVEQYARLGLPGLVGGPWTGDVVNGLLVPGANWPLGVSILACVALAVPVLRTRHPVVTVALLGLAGYFVGGVLLLLVTQQGVTVYGMTARFLADLVPVVVVLLAVALRKALVPPGIRGVVSSAPALTAVAVSALFIASAAITTAELVPTLQNEDDRSYLANISDGLDADPRIVLLDGPVPAGIMSPWFGKDARVSTVADLLPQEPAFDLPSEFLRIVDGTGLTRTIDLLAPVASVRPPDENCGFPVRSSPAEVEMAAAVTDGEKVMRIGYYINADTYAVADTGAREIRFPVRNGLHAIDIPVEQGFEELTLTLESLDHTLCVTSVEVGVAIPAPLPGAK